MDLKLILKNKIIKKLWILSVIQLLCVLSIPISSYAQSSKQPTNIEGIVTDSNGAPLLGATVLEKGTTNGTQTDFDGKFSLQVSDKNVIILVSFIGYTAQEISLNNSESLTIVLQEDSSSLDEIVVVGYGSQSKAKLTNSIATIKGAKLVDIPITSFEEGLAGQVAGVQIVQTSGDPGSSSTINIRGVSSVTAGTRPLIVVDGFPSENFNIKSINPSAIESIDILKDAAAAAIYGSRGANGVILVTTKKGKPGETKFTLDSYYGVGQVANIISTQNAYERARYASQALINRGKPPIAAYQPYLIGVPGLTDTNWQNEIFRSANVQNHNFTVSGATDKMDFFVAGGYFDQEGIVLGSDFNRINLRANVNYDISDNFRGGVKIAPSFSTRNKVSADDHKGDGIILTALMANPLFKPYNADGSLNLSGDMMAFANKNGQTPVANPVALALLNKDKRTGFDLLASSFLEYEPIKGLTFKTFLATDYSSNTRKSFSPNTVGSYSVSIENKQAKAFNSFYKRRNWMIENTVNYRKKISNGHHLNFLFGQSFQTEDIKTTGSSPLLPQVVNNGNVLLTTYPLFEEKWSLISYISRINYDIKNKYIFGASLRRDGSSRFGANTKWGWFPSVSTAWRIHEENFFNSEVVNEFKVRGSWGVTGNNRIGNYSSIPLLGPSNYGKNTGFSPITAPNKNLAWEQTNTLDIGIDLGLFDNKVFITTDYYRSITNDLLLQVSVPAHSGNTTSLRNFGKVENSGFEFAINVSKIKLGYVKWSSSFNISTNRNKVLALGPDQNRIETAFHLTEVGKPIGSYYTYRKIGVFNTQEQIDNAPTHPEQRLGDYIFKDLNGDGKITSADKEISGNFFPDYTFGFSNTFKYKNFSFNFLIQGKQGYKIFNGTSFFIRNLEGWSNGHTDINNYYSASNPNATYASPGKHTKTYEQSDLFVEDGSYIRLRKVSLSYKFPKKYLKNTFIKNTKLYISARNLLTITGYSGYNPEVSSRNSSFNNQSITPGFDYGAYPIARTFVLGANLSF